LGSLPFYERGEGREGLVIWEMIHSGNWILPAVNGEYIPFKPPLFHWLAALVSVLTGRLDEFVIRFPSALMATSGVLLIYCTARRWWDRGAALAASVVLATSFGWWQAATIAQVDMVLSFFIGAALLLFYSLYRSEIDRKRKAIALAILLAFATLAKGPLGLAAPAIVIVSFLLVQRDLRFILRLPLLAGGLAYIAVAGLWYACAYAQGGWAFLQRQVVEETVLTGVGEYGRNQPIYYYLPVIFYDLAPWSFFLPALASFLYQRRNTLAADRLLYPLLWFVVTLGFYSLARGKRGIYMLPVYPALALLFGAWWAKLAAGKEEWSAPARWLGWLYVIVCITSAFGVGYYIAGGAEHLPVLTKKLHSVGVLEMSGADLLAMKYALVALLGLIVFLAWNLRRQAWWPSFAAFAAIAILQLACVRAVYFPHFVAPRTFKPFVAKVSERVAPPVPLVFYHGFDAAVTFYSGRHIPEYESARATLHLPYFLLMWEEDFQRIGQTNKLALIDISEGKGPALRHHLVLAQPTTSAALVERANPAGKSKGE